MPIKNPTTRTSKQLLGDFGEMLVVKKASCPQCNKPRTLKKLPTNFKCADIICDFCGVLAQVKTCTVVDVDVPPRTLLGAAWGPQKERLRKGIVFDLYIVLKNERRSAIYFLSKKNQTHKLFTPRKPLSETARRAGWQGFYYDLIKVQHKLERVL